MFVHLVEFLLGWFTIGRSIAKWNYLYYYQIYSVFGSVGFYQSVHFYSNPYYKYRIKDTGHLILAILFLILLMIKPGINHKDFQTIYLSMVLGNALFYTGLSYLKILKHRKNIESFASSKENIDLRWILWIIYATIAASITTAFYNIFLVKVRWIFISVFSLCW